MPQVTTQLYSYDYEWMNALAQAGDLFGDLFGGGSAADSGIVIQPFPVPVPQPAPAPQPSFSFDQVPAWAWALAGLLVAALLFRK